MEILGGRVDTPWMTRILTCAFFGILSGLVWPASVGAQTESAARLSPPQAPGTASAPAASTASRAPRSTSPRRASTGQRRRGLRVSLAVAAGLGAAFSVGVAELAAHRRAGPCAVPQPDETCDRARRATGIGAFAATSILVTPLSLWVAGRLTKGRGGYMVPWLMTGVGLMVGGLGFAMTQSLARHAWGRRIGFGLSGLMPATFGALGYLARDGERRRFAGSVAFAPQRDGGALYYTRTF